VSWRARWGALSAGRRVAILCTAIVAAGAAVMSWDANTWAAGEIGVEPRWVYGICLDGAIAVCTAAVFELRGWRAAPAWALLLGALTVSVVGNAAHARPGNVLHTVGSTVPVLLVAACLFLLELVVRTPAPAVRAEERGAPPPPPEERAPRTRRARKNAPRAGRRPEARVLYDGRMVSAGHARKLRAAARRAEVADAA
jgi:Protein of unknown function (DUF2637)